MWGIRLVWMEEEYVRSVGREETGETLRGERGERTRGNRAVIGQRQREGEGEGDKAKKRVSMRGFVYVEGSLLFLWLGLTARDQPRLLVRASGQQRQ